MEIRGLHWGATTTWMIAMLSLAGCPAPDATTNGDGTTTGEDSTGAPTVSDTEGMSGANTVSNSGDSSSGLPPGVDSTGDSGEESAGFITSPTDTGGLDPQPNGAMCTGNADCESGFCFEVPQLGGFCSECVNDSDCEMGTCSIDVNLLYAVCTDGSVGVMCDSSRGCMEGLVCEPLIDTGGLFPLDFCSECGAEQPCEKGQICSPIYDTVAFQGYHGCVDPGMVEDGGGCPIVAPGMGNGEVCASGNCAVADVFGVVEIGVCGECDNDEDCTEPAVCMPPMVDMSGITPSACG